MSAARRPSTVAAANGIATDESFGAVAPPVYLSSTFAFAAFEQSRGYDYTRTANPTRDLLADTLAKLEGGIGAIVTASGMAAVDLILSQLRRDELVIAPHDCYGGTYRLLCGRRERGQFDVVFVDQADNNALAVALDASPALVFIETPSNPLMRVVDIKSVAQQARAVGAKIAVDNTFLSPALQRPLGLGADFVVHSTTKYLNGHSDVVGGAVVCADQNDFDTLFEWANIAGVGGAPFDAYLTLRGVRTLFPRVACQQANAGAIATYLEAHRAVEVVHYPGLVSHAGHAIAKAQQDGFGAMLSFELTDASFVQSFVEKLGLFTLAESLGGIESLVAHPATMTHSGMGAEARRIAGINDSLIRLSIGLESFDDLKADLEQALAALPSAG